MTATFRLTVVMSVVSVLMILSLLQVDGQSTVEDYSASCPYSTLDEAVNLIKTELNSVKSACTANQQQSSLVDTSSLSRCVPLLIQQNVDGTSFFNRSWAEFKVGFSDKRGNYWLGNDLLHQLTQNGRYKLRFDLQLTSGSWNWAQYTTFAIQNETFSYKLQVSGHSGGTGYDAFNYHNGMMFTTYDRDNDQDTKNCAVSNGGGFWFKGCVHCGVNTARTTPGGFKWYRYPAADLSLSLSRMWLTCQ